MIMRDKKDGEKWREPSVAMTEKKCRRDDVVTQVDFFATVLRKPIFPSPSFRGPTSKKSELHENLINHNYQFALILTVLFPSSTALSSCLSSGYIGNSETFFHCLWTYYSVLGNHSEEKIPIANDVVCWIIAPPVDYWLTVFSSESNSLILPRFSFISDLFRINSLQTYTM